MSKLTEVSEKLFLNSAIGMKNIPSLLTDAPAYFLRSSVHSLDLSEYGPLYSSFPQGFLILTSLMVLPFASLTSCALRTVKAWFIARPFASLSK